MDYKSIYLMDTYTICVIMNSFNLVNDLSKSKLCKQFKASRIKCYRWLPLCRYNSPSLPVRTVLESYYKCIKTRGNVVKKKSFRLKNKKTTLFSNWRFPFKPNKYKISNGWLFTKIPNKYICVSVEKDSTQKVHSTLIPKNIKLYSKDFTAIGLLKGEMISSTRGKSRHYVSFTNAEPLLVKIVLDFLEKMGLKKSDISFQIIVNLKKNKMLRPEEYVNHWSKEINVSKIFFVKPYFDTRYRTSYSWGSLSLKYYNTQFRLFLQFLVNYVIDNIDKNYVANFLKGLLATEGSVSLSPNNSLNFISIGCSKKDDIVRYKRVLHKLGIDAGGIVEGISNTDAVKRGWKKGTGEYMMLQGWDNFRTGYVNNLFEFSPNKRLRFLYSLVNHREARKSRLFKNINEDFEIMRKNHAEIYNSIVKQRNSLTEGEEKILSIIEGSRGITRNYLSRHLGILPSSASRRLVSMQLKGRVRKLSVDGEKLWFLT